MIRTAILDKLSLARRRLTTLLSRESDISIVYANQGAFDPGEVIRNVRPELVFLDLELLDAGVLKAVAAPSVAERPKVVFVTAYEHFAVHAFTAGAIDYLLKPVTSPRMQLCLSRVRQSIRAGTPFPSPTPAFADSPPQRPAAELPAPARIAIRSGKKRFLIALDSIEWCEAAGNYIIFHVGPERHMVRGAIGDLPEMLGSHRFPRISKSTVVNVGKVSFIEQVGAGDLELGLANGTTHVVSRVYRKNLEDCLPGIASLPAR